MHFTLQRRACKDPYGKWRVRPLQYGDGHGAEGNLKWNTDETQAFPPSKDDDDKDNGHVRVRPGEMDLT